MAEKEEIIIKDVFDSSSGGSLLDRVIALEEAMLNHGHTGRGSSTIQSTMRSANFASGEEGWQIKDNGDVEFNNGTFRGAIVGATIDIGGSDASSFHVDINGNMWLGAATYGSAPFKVGNTGNLFASNADISGTIDADAGTIGGWSIAETTLSASNITLSNTGVITVGSGNNRIVLTAGTDVAKMEGFIDDGGGGSVKNFVWGIVDDSGPSTYNIVENLRIAPVIGSLPSSPNYPYAALNVFSADYLQIDLYSSAVDIQTLFFDSDGFLSNNNGELMVLKVTGVGPDVNVMDFSQSGHIATNQVFKLRNDSSDPAVTEEGGMYYNTSTGKIKVYTSSGWETVTSS